VGLFFLTIFKWQQDLIAESVAKKESLMARKPNYDFEKRQKEIAKKAKKDEKKKRKLEDAAAEEAQEVPVED
jgi:hypothetical protein